MQVNYLSVPVKVHKPCGTNIESKLINVSKEVFSSGKYSVDYCSKCEIYLWGADETGKRGVRSKNPDDVAKYIEDLQRKTNKEFNN